MSNDLIPGEYHLEIRGPKGVILRMAMDLRTRAPFEGALDEEWLRELLVVTSVAGGWVEGVMHQEQAAAKGKGEGAA